MPNNSADNEAWPDKDEATNRRETVRQIRWLRRIFRESKNDTATLLHWDGIIVHTHNWILLVMMVNSWLFRTGKFHRNLPCSRWISWPERSGVCIEFHGESRTGESWGISFVHANSTVSRTRWTRQSDANGRPQETALSKFIRWRRRRWPRYRFQFEGEC